MISPARLPSPFGLYYGWVIVGCAMVMNAASSWMSPFMFSFFINPMGQDLGWTRGEMSLALTCRLVTAGLIGPIMGQLIDRHGSRWVGAGAGLLAGASIIATSYASELWVLYGIFIVSGFAGFGGPAGALLSNVPVGKWFVAQRGRAMAVATIGFPFGIIVSVPAAQWIIDTAGWRAAWFVIGGAVIVTLAPTCALFMRRVPEDHGLRPDGVATAAPRTSTGVTPFVREVSLTRREAFQHPTAWLILLASMLSAFVFSGTLVQRVAFWQDLGVSPSMVALGSSADPFIFVFSALAFGLLAERIPLRYLGVVGLLGCAVSMAPMIFTTGQVALVFLHAVIWGLSAGAMVSFNNLVWPSYFGRGSLGAIQGVALPAMVIANGMGSPAYGYLLDLGVRPSLVWTFTFVVLVIAGLVVGFARPPKLENMVARPEATET